MKLVNEHLLASEADIRSGKSAESLGPATTFYQQLKVVLRRPPTPPSPIPIPRNFRPTTLNTVFPPIPESEASTSDSSYQPSPPASRHFIPSSIGRGTTEGVNRPRTSMDSIRSDDSHLSISSTEEDKLEAVANQAAVSLLGLLCTFEDVTHPNRERKLVLTYFTVSKN